MIRKSLVNLRGIIRFQLIDSGALVHESDNHGKSIAQINKARPVELQDPTINSIVAVYDWVYTGLSPEEINNV